MKLFQITIAVGAAAAVTLGPAAYAGGAAPSTVTGHLFQEAPGGVLTGREVAERCRAAYTALQTYQVTSAVTVHSVEGPSGKVEDEHASAVIQFARPGKIHVEGLDTEAKPFAYVSDGLTTFQTDSPKSGSWKKVPGYHNPNGIEMAIGRVTGIAMNAATTVPALLMSTDPSVTYLGWGVPQPLGKDLLSFAGNPTNPIGKTSSFEVTFEVKDGAIDGSSYYILIPHGSIIFNKEAFWIDKKTFLLRRIVTDSDTAAGTIPDGKGGNQALPALKMHQEENYTNERVNAPLPDSTFTLPAAQ